MFMEDKLIRSSIIIIKHPVMPGTVANHESIDKQCVPVETFFFIKFLFY